MSAQESQQTWRHTRTHRAKVPSQSPSHRSSPQPPTQGCRPSSSSGRCPVDMHDFQSHFFKEILSKGCALVGLTTCPSLYQLQNNLFTVTGPQYPPDFENPKTQSSGTCKTSPSGSYPWHRQPAVNYPKQSRSLLLVMIHRLNLEATICQPCPNTSVMIQNGPIAEVPQDPSGKAAPMSLILSGPAPWKLERSPWLCDDVQAHPEEEL